MTNGFLLAAGAALTIALSPATTLAQAQGTPVEAPVLAGAALDTSCGNLYGLAGQAFCVTAPLASIGGIAEAYIAHFEAEGWIPAGGDDNRVVFVKRHAGGGCDAMQLQAFYDTNRPAGPEVPGYIAMATIPGDICAAAPAQPVTPPTP